MAIPLLRESIHRKSPMQSSRVAGQETFLPRSSGRVTVYSEAIPKKCGSVRLGDHTLMTKEEGSVQLEDAAWPLRDAYKVSFH
jgi:hypothetical protein